MLLVLGGDAQGLRRVGDGSLDRGSAPVRGESRACQRTPGSPVRSKAKANDSLSSHPR